MRYSNLQAAASKINRLEARIRTLQAELERAEADALRATDARLEFLRNTFHETTDLCLDIDDSLAISSVKSGIRGRTTRVWLKIEVDAERQRQALNTVDLPLRFQGYKIVAVPLTACITTSVISVFLESTDPMFFDEWIETAADALTDELCAARTDIDICVWDVNSMLAGSFGMREPLKWLQRLVLGAFGRPQPMELEHTTAAVALRSYCMLLPSCLQDALDQSFVAEVLTYGVV